MICLWKCLEMFWKQHTHRMLWLMQRIDVPLALLRRQNAINVCLFFFSFSFFSLFSFLFLFSFLYDFFLFFFRFMFRDEFIWQNLIAVETWTFLRNNLNGSWTRNTAKTILQSCPSIITLCRSWIQLNTQDMQIPTYWIICVWYWK